VFVVILYQEDYIRHLSSSDLLLGLHILNISSLLIFLKYCRENTKPFIMNKIVQYF